MGQIQSYSEQSTINDSDLFILQDGSSKVYKKTSALTMREKFQGAGIDAWTSWTPTLSNFTIGTGGSANVTGYYEQSGKTVRFRLSAVLGTSGASVGSNPTFTLPVTAATYTSTLFPIGIISLVHSGAAKNGWVTYGSTTTAVLRVWDANNDQGAVTASLPFVWAAGDGFYCSGQYEAA